MREQAYPRDGIASKTDDIVEFDVGYLGIIHTDHQTGHLGCEYATMSILGVEIASNVAPARIIDHKRQRFVRCRLVYPNIELSSLTIRLFVPC
jgi:hypothetical protein